MPLTTSFLNQVLQKEPTIYSGWAFNAPGPGRPRGSLRRPKDPLAAHNNSPRTVKTTFLIVKLAFTFMAKSRYVPPMRPLGRPWRGSGLHLCKVVFLSGFPETSTSPRGLSIGV